MKTLPARPMKLSNNFGKEKNRDSLKCQLFLGHKVLSELRILMRLASGQSNGFGPLNGYDHPSSF